MVGNRQVVGQAEEGTLSSEAQDNGRMASDAQEGNGRLQEVKEAEDLGSLYKNLAEIDRKRIGSAAVASPFLDEEEEAHLELDRLITEEKLLRIQLRRTEIQMSIARKKKGINAPSKK